MSENLPESAPETYTLAELGVIRDSDGASIPEDVGNRDWRAFQVWLAQGNIPNPFAPEEPDPEALAVAALRHAAKGKIAAVADLTPEEADAVLGINGDPVS